MWYLRNEKYAFSLTWLEQIADHPERLLRVEQAICTSGVCNTLLFPVMGKPNSEISGSREVFALSLHSNLNEMFE